MPYTGDESLVTRTDYIWKVLRMQHFWMVLSTILLTAYAAYVTYAFWNLTAIIGLCVFFFAVIAIYMTVNQFRWGDYLKSVGGRRDKAMQGTRFSMVSVQPLVQFPVPATLRLSTSKLQLRIASLIMLVVVVLMIVALMRPALHNNQDSQLAFFTTNLFVFGIFMLVGAVFYFYFSLSYKEQSIEISELGVKTRFMRQERFLRWDEIRLFATYETQETYKNSIAKLQIYEISNEQTALRWSQISATYTFLSVQSNLGEKEDWNWLLGRVNAFVSDRTKLPLVNLGEDRQQEVAGQADHNHAPSAVLLAKNDPVMKRLQAQGGSGNIGWAFGLLSALLIVFGLLGNLPATAQYLSIINGGFGYVLLALGVLSLFFTVFIVAIMQASRQYWQRIGQLRQVAFQEPERYTASQQPARYEDLPQPTNVRIRAGRQALILSMLITFVLYFGINFSIHFFADEHKSLIPLLISTLITSLIYAVGMGFLSFYLTRRTNQQRIEVTSNGLNTHMYNTDSSIHWQDLRSFARYRSQKWFKRSSKLYVYELAGEDVVVRITMPTSFVTGNKVEPKMTPEEFERWYEQLYGYIIQRTGLPLLDLDTPGQNK